MGYIDESHPFSCGSVLKKFQGTIYHLHDLQIRPTRIRREDILGKSWRCATFDAENVQTGEPVILLLRVESVRLLHILNLETLCTNICAGQIRLWSSNSL
jgi:hypothetical protein